MYALAKKIQDMALFQSRRKATPYIFIASSSILSFSPEEYRPSMKHSHENDIWGQSQAFFS
jgi:hypothetical protein